MNLNLNGGSRADRKMSLVLANFNDFAETIEKPLDREQFRGGGGYPPEAPPREVKLRRVTGSEMLKKHCFYKQNVQFV